VAVSVTRARTDAGGARGPSLAEPVAGLDTPLLARDGGRAGARTRRRQRPRGRATRVGFVGSRAQENVAAARDLLEPLVAELDAALAATHPQAQAVLTGHPIIRQSSLEAISRSLQLSVPVAVLLCLLCAWGFMRSLRYALVSMVPIVLVIAWLYGVMHLAGFSSNLVTATIGAISIGVGIDFATHMTMRFREELRGQGSRLAALRAATAGTGVALVGSALSSVAGFAILAFAPMPMFASYGLLTAVMIGLALSQASSYCRPCSCSSPPSRRRRRRQVATTSRYRPPSAGSGPWAMVRRGRGGGRPRGGVFELDPSGAGVGHDQLRHVHRLGHCPSADRPTRQG
jgi:hypothetical protein